MRYFRKKKKRWKNRRSVRGSAPKPPSPPAAGRSTLSHLAAGAWATRPLYLKTVISFP